MAARWAEHRWATLQRTNVGDQPPRASFSKLKPVQCDEILRRYQAGDRPVDIARDFGVTEWTVQNVRKRAGVAVRGRSMSSDEVDRAARLKTAGTSLRKIAIAVGYDARTVTNELRARGLWT